MFYGKIELNLEAVHSTGQHCKFYRSIFGFCEELVQKAVARGHCTKKNRNNSDVGMLQAQKLDNF